MLQLSLKSDGSSGCLVECESLLAAVGPAFSGERCLFMGLGSWVQAMIQTEELRLEAAPY